MKLRWAPRLTSSELNAFRIVARERSFTGAARVLHTSQSSLSRRIRALEDKLQVCLLTRGAQGADLTESGRKLLRHVDRLCLHEEEIIAELRGQHPQSLHGLLRVAAASPVLREVVVPALGALLRANPGALVELACDDGPRLDRWLAEGRVDLVVSATPQARRGFNSVRLGAEMRVMLESSWHRERDAILLELTESATIPPECAAAGTRVSQCVLGDSATLLRAVEQGYGRALLPTYLVAPALAVRRVAQSPPLSVEQYVVHSCDVRHARLVRAVVESLQAGAPNLLARDPAGLLSPAAPG